jgi:iron complex outermembrane receptor protein
MFVASVHFRRHAIASAALLTLSSSLVQAGSAAGEIELPAVVITGSNQPQQGGLPRNLPANSSGYSARELQEQVNVINTEDIVKYSPDTMTRKRYIGDRNAIIETRTASVTSSARSLVYVDGFLLSNLLGNSYSYPARWNMVSPAEIQRVDFFFGPYSAAFPGNSIGTTVLMTTQMPKSFEVHAKAQVFSENFEQYNNHSTYQGNNVNATAGNKSGDLGWVIGVNRLQSTGHPMSFVTLDPSKGTVGTAGAAISNYAVDTDPNGARRIIIGETSQEETTQKSAKLKLAYDLGASLKINYLLGVWQNDSYNHSSSYLQNAAGNPVSTGTVNIEGKSYSIPSNSFAENVWSQTHVMNALGLKSNTRTAWDWDAQFTSYRIVQDEQHTSQPQGAVNKAGTIAENPYGDGWTTLDVKGYWRSASENRGPREHEVAFGYHADAYKLDSTTYYTNATAGNDSWQTAPSLGTTAALKSASAGKTSTQALFVQDAWRLQPGWKFTPGLRAEQWQATGGQNRTATAIGTYVDRSKNFLSPKLALEYDTQADWLLKASLGRAYRTPTVNELFQTITVGTSISNNNPDLKPEKATSTELTAEHELDNGKLRISFFLEDMKDAIYAQKTVVDSIQVTAYSNIDHVRTQGLTLAYQQADVGVRGFDLTGSLTYAHAVTLADAAMPAAEGKVYPGVPNWRATLVGTYRPNERSSVSLAGRYAGRQYNSLDNSDVNPNTYGSNSEFLVVDTRVTWKFSDTIKGAFGIDNLFNRKYYAFHPMPNRTLHAEVGVDF